MTDGTLSHLARRCPPWRDPNQTECGRPVTDVVKVITRGEAETLIGKHGKQRSMFLLCMTCVSTSDRYRDWDTSPTDVIAREGSSKWRPELTLMDRELVAIAALIEAHRDEFDGFLNALDETVSLRDRRAAKRAATPRTTGYRL